MLKRHALPALAAALALSPSMALAAQRMLTPAGIFNDAAQFQKLLMLALIAGIVTAGVVAGRKLTSGPSLSGGSAFISGLRLGGPLIGALGATYSAMNSAIGVANINPQNLNVLAPGIAESLLVFGLGVFAGTVAVILHWAIESRIDRQVLQAR